jgi:redox-sensitive bicupin YhaK (pirin superfamily)
VSWQPTTEPECIVDPTRAPIDSVIVPRRRDVGGFDVMRALPSAERRAVGPFVFFDQFGPLQLIQGRSLEVRPHPHIGLATVTYVFAGKIMHRDSLGTVQPIQPGEVNWMTAGRGIVHSERTSSAGNPPGAELFGIQTWVALPKSHEEIEPAFAHHARAELPEVEGEGVWSRIILGTCFGRSSAVATYADPVYVDCLLGAGARVSLPAEIEERAVSIVSGELQVGKQRFAPGTLAVFTPKAEVVLTTDVATHFILIGGPKLDGPRIVWWNFVSSSQERIEAAKADWRAGRFAPVSGDHEFIPLPE